MEELIKELDLDGIIAVHSRAEELAGDDQYREKFDVSTSRAVANLSTLSEYCLPFVHIGGTFVSYKSGSVEDELSSAENAIDILGGTLSSVEKFSIPGTTYERSFCIIDKIKSTDKKYPRRSGTPSKKPL